ncbi:MAG TPA: hypothetical protein VGA55_01735 [Bacteroidota bacterium]
MIANFQKGMDAGGYLDSIEVLSLVFSCDLASVVTRYPGRAGGRNVDGRDLLVWRKLHGTWRVATHMTAVRD